VAATVVDKVRVETLLPASDSYARLNRLRNRRRLVETLVIVVAAVSSMRSVTRGQEVQLRRLHREAIQSGTWFQRDLSRSVIRSGVPPGRSDKATSGRRS